HIGDATAQPIKAAGIRTAALLGTKSTMELDFLKQRLARYEISTLIPNKADRNFINDSIFGELEKEIINPKTKARFVEIIDGLVSQGAEGVILGCTEIPLLIKQADCSVPTFDTTELHADAVVSYALATHGHD
ncbi:MAG TPA: amino acid racemase, partial [Longimicrobiales bacterium]|nr:amino acid racemase [Longimicrobiales bacterium]